MANFEITGVTEAVRSINKQAMKVKRDTPEAMRDIGSDLLRRSVKRAPKDTGHLRGSGFMEINSNTVTVAFSAPYALRQHEHTEYRHTDGEAKYLERPLKENQNKYIKHLSDSLKKGLK